MNRIPFIITVDTEGDNLWFKPAKITTENTKGLVRFQSLCNQFGFKPVYLTNYEMAMDDAYVSFASRHAKCGECEVGMHLHGWNSPPIKPINDNDYSEQPFLTDYPDDVLEEKVVFMTELLRERFEMPIVSHRSGRWAMSSHYMKVLEQNGYLVDCSVTPGINWAKTSGTAQGNGGPDYTKYPLKAYFPDLEYLNRSGNCKVLEVPMTVVNSARVECLSFLAPVAPYLPGIARRLLFRNQWLRLWKGNLESVLRLANEQHRSGAQYIEFMIHSSELTAGLNPYFPTDEDNEMLYSMMETLFTTLSSYTYGCTLQEFHSLFRSKE